MAGSFSVVSQIRTVQVLGPTQVLDVEQVGFVTHPTGIYAEFPVPLVTWRQGGAGTLIGPLSEAIENLIAGSAATGASYLQDIDESGLLVDFLDVIVEYVPPDGTRPPMTTSVPIPLEAFLAAGDVWFAQSGVSPAQLVDEAYQALAATAGL